MTISVVHTPHQSQEAHSVALVSPRRPGTNQQEIFAPVELAPHCFPPPELVLASPLLLSPM